MAERSTLSSRDARQAKKIAISSMLNQSGGVEPDLEVPVNASYRVASSVVIVLVTFAVLSLVLFAVNSFLEVDVPTLTDVLQRMVYIIRMHGFAAAIIPIDLAVQLLSRPSSCLQFLSTDQSSSQLVLLAMVNIITVSLEEEYSKLIIACLTIWILGRFSVLASVCISDRYHVIPSAVSLFPILVAVVLMLLSLWEHGPCCGLDKVGLQPEPPKETVGYFF